MGGGVGTAAEKRYRGGGGGGSLRAVLTREMGHFATRVGGGGLCVRLCVCVPLRVRVCMRVVEKGLMWARELAGMGQGACKL